MFGLLLALTLVNPAASVEPSRVTVITWEAPAEEDGMGFYCLGEDGNLYCGDSVIVNGPCLTYPDGGTVCKFGNMRLSINYPDVYGDFS